MPIALFDLDNTLFDRTGFFRHFAQAFASTRALDADAVEWLCLADDDGFTDRRRLWHDAKVRFGLADSLEDLVEAYYADYLELLAPDPAVLAGLSALRDDGWRIGIVTNADDLPQLRKAERLGFMPLVDAFCTSGGLGVAKPDRRIFDEAITRCCTAHGTSIVAQWMVGDSPAADVAGARALGLASIWLRRGRQWDAADGPEPDVSVDSIFDAIEVVRASRR
jgi:putative hydrolase of the HAD superfamily